MCWEAPRLQGSWFCAQLRHSSWCSLCGGPSAPQLLRYSCRLLLPDRRRMNPERLPRKQGLPLGCGLAVGPELGSHLLWSQDLPSRRGLCRRLPPRLSMRGKLRQASGLRLGSRLAKGLTQQSHEELLRHGSVWLGGNGLQSRVLRHGVQGCELLRCKLRLLRCRSRSSVRNGGGASTCWLGEDAALHSCGLNAHSWGLDRWQLL